MKRLLAIVIALCLLLSGCASQLEPLGDSEALFAAPSTPDPEALHGLPRLETEEHIPYMSAYPSGRFLPDGVVRRGEACQMLYTLLANPIEGHCSFADLDPKDACYEAVAGLTAWGVISDSTGNFNPNGLFSRAQLMTMLAAFYPAEGEGEAPYIGSFLRREAEHESSAILPGIASFTDTANHWASAAIENAVARGWIEAGGEFGPDVALTRWEFCRILNTVLGRKADAGTAVLSPDVPQYSDVPANHEAYADIMEASIPHDYSRQDDIEIWQDYALSPGFHRVQGQLYYVDSEGQLVRNQSYKNWQFDENGRYTTGVAEVDAMLAQVLQELGTDDMSASDALRAAYRYCVQDKVYIKHPWVSYGCEDDRDEHAYRALRFMETGGGTCYDFAAAFGLLARSLGYHCYIVYAQINQYYAEHGWVVIPEDGVNYIYDPEMEATRPWRHSGYDLFGITNHSIYHYWYDPWW